MRKILFALLLTYAFSAQAQEEEDENYGYLSGGVESNFKWYIKDENTKTDPFYIEDIGGDYLRANNYLRLDYTYNKWAAGIQVESYVPRPLLGYPEIYDDSGIATYYAEYQSEKIKITAGYYYEQFGSGLILRSWENRQLGLNNALRGGRIIYSPLDEVVLTALYGQQREGFEVSDGHVFGFDTEIDLMDLLKSDDFGLDLGFSYVGRYEEIDSLPMDEKPNFDELTNAFSGRLDFSKNRFYAGAEYVYKSEDVVVERIPGRGATLNNDFIKPGSALLINFGYVAAGFGTNLTFRRLENMAFFSERKSFGDPDNPNVNTINYIPALTRQHDYLLSNIYVYQAQPKISIFRPSIQKAGEVGGQFDLYYTFEKGTSLGGEFGTNIALNASYYANLKGKYDTQNRDYNVDFMGFGEKYFSDISLEVKKQLSKKWKTIFTYINQYYNRRLVEERSGVIKANIGVAEATYKIKDQQSVRMVLQHLWSEEDKKNWVGAVLEFNLNSNFSFYASDIYNYGNEIEEERVHYYNIGGSYTKGAARLAINYGRQRGGVVCVGGVCRKVPESTGLSVNLSIVF